MFFCLILTKNCIRRKPLLIEDTDLPKKKNPGLAARVSMVGGN